MLQATSTGKVNHSSIRASSSLPGHGKPGGASASTSRACQDRAPSGSATSSHRRCDGGRRRAAPDPPSNSCATPRCPIRGAGPTRAGTGRSGAAARTGSPAPRCTACSKTHTISAAVAGRSTTCPAVGLTSFAARSRAAAMSPAGTGAGAVPNSLSTAPDTSWSRFRALARGFSGTHSHSVRCCGGAASSSSRVFSAASAHAGHRSRSTPATTARTTSAGSVAATSDSVRTCSGRVFTAAVRASSSSRRRLTGAWR